MVVGFVALSIFEGYFSYVYRALEQEAVIGERLGHLTVVKPDFYEKGSTSPRDYFFTADELGSMEREIASLEGVVLLSPRLQTSGLISNGSASHIFLSEGISAADLQQLRQGEYAEMSGVLDAENELAVLLGSALADKLGVEADDLASSELVMMTSTVDGMVNASDVDVRDISNTGSVGTDDKFVPHLTGSRALSLRVRRG